MHDSTAVRVPSYLPWLVVFSAAMFFFYEFIQMQMFNAISQAFLNDFHITATTLGYIASSFFLANVIFVFPAGILLDRFSTRKIILSTLGITVLSTVLLARAHSVYEISIYHFAAGIGNAFCFLSSIRLASRWFPAEKMALVLGSVIALAMLGGMVAQTPLTYLITKYDWRNAMLIVAGLGLLIMILIWTVVRDCPPDKIEFYKNQHEELKAMGLAKSIKLALSNLQNWTAGLFISFLNVPLMVLGGLWGSLYLTTVHHITALQASYVISALFLGSMVGFPVIGWLSDRMKLRRRPMIVFMILALMIMLEILYVQNLSLIKLLMVFFLFGFVMGAQTVGYPAISESNEKTITGTAMGISATLIMAAPMIAEPLYGWLMDKKWNGEIINNIRIYNSQAYHCAMYMLVVILAAGLIAAFCVKETYAREK